MPARRSRSRRARRTRQATGAGVILACWLIIRGGLGVAPAVFCAGFVAGFLACFLVMDVLRSRAERLARRLGTRTRTAANRPLPRVPRPASTPIHDEAARRQNGG